MKLFKFFSKGFGEVKENFKQYKGVYILSFLCTVLLAISYEYDWYLEKLDSGVMRKVLIFYACSGVLVWLTEVLFSVLWKQIIGYIVSIGVGIGFAYYTVVEKQSTTFNHIMLGYIVFVLCIVFFSLIKKSKLDAHKYLLDIFQNIFNFNIVFGIIAIGINLIVSVFDVLLLEGEEYIIFEIVWIVLMGWVYISGIVYSVTRKKSHITMFIENVVKYVLYPLTIIAVVIIYIYIIKMFIYLDMPSNEVYRIVTWLFVLGYTSVIMVKNYIKDNKFFEKTWLIIVIAYIPLIVLQIVSLSIRCKEYGITISRYMGMCGILIEVIVVLLSLIKINKKDRLESVLIVVAVVSIIATMSPINMRKISIESQRKILENTWKENMTFDKLSEEKQEKVISIYNYMLVVDEENVEEYLPKYISKKELDKVSETFTLDVVEDGYVIINYGDELADCEIDIKEYSNIRVKFKDYYQKFDEKNDKDKVLNKEIDKKINELYEEYGKNLDKELEKNNKVNLSKDRDMIILDLKFDAEENSKVKLYDAKVKVLILEK